METSHGNWNVLREELFDKRVAVLLPLGHWVTVIRERQNYDSWTEEVIHSAKWDSSPSFTLWSSQHVALKFPAVSSGERVHPHGRMKYAAIFILNQPLPHRIAARVDTNYVLQPTHLLFECHERTYF